MKLTRGEIAVVIGMVMVIITINAWWRVKALGQAEQARQMEEAQRKLDAGAD